MARQGSGINPRAIKVLVGALIGLVWGTVMWLILGQDGGGRGWIYVAMTTAMIGSGVAAFFGAFEARKRGERIGPKIGRKDK
jgi:hypothetical protein